jgi:hypothetical protein
VTGTAVSSSIIPPDPPTVTTWTKGDHPTVSAWAKETGRPTVATWTKNQAEELPLAA